MPHPIYDKLEEIYKDLHKLIEDSNDYGRFYNNELGYHMKGYFQHQQLSIEHIIKIIKKDRDKE